MERFIILRPDAIFGVEPCAIACYRQIAKLLPFENEKPILPVLGSQNKYVQQVRDSGRRLCAKHLFLTLETNLYELVNGELPSPFSYSLNLNGNGVSHLPRLL